MFDSLLVVQAMTEQLQNNTYEEILIDEVRRLKEHQAFNRIQYVSCGDKIS